MDFKIAVIKGDGVGQEIINEGIKILRKIEEKHNHKFELKEVLVGGIAIDKEGVPLPQKTLKICKESDACLLYTSPSPRDRQKARMPSSA